MLRVNNKRQNITGGAAMIEGKQAEQAAGRLRFGMIGGGTGSFIGDVHRKAAVFDGWAQLDAGCFPGTLPKPWKPGETLG